MVSGPDPEDFSYLNKLSLNYLYHYFVHGTNTNGLVQNILYHYFVPGIKYLYHYWDLIQIQYKIFVPDGVPMVFLIGVEILGNYSGQLLNKIRVGGVIG